MSVDFTIAQAGQAQPLFELMVNIECEMEKAGFKKNISVYKVGLDERGVFEESEKYVISGKKFRESESDLKGWEGLSVEFYSKEYTVYFLICNYKNQYINSFIEVSGKVIEKLQSENKINSFMKVISIVALNMKSQGGFGTFELPFEPVPPEKIISCIFNTPDGVPALMGLVSHKVADEVEIRNKASSEFKIYPLNSSFYFFENKDFSS
ncbi:hypothetical protein MNBD_GAMMA11-558 [hydrothermal vent metagenome]|uniref:Uncharacterized protein n=1 Tax=hydrothermal vent metagenome TaxID=652676 RepID=A0A3B0XMU4_9ZZZZ